MRLIRPADCFDSGDDVAGYRVFDLVVQEQSMVPTGHEKIIVVRKDDPAVVFGKPCYLDVGGVVAKRLVHSGCRDTIDTLERRNVFRGRILVAENPQLLGAAEGVDGLLTCLFLCP